MSDDGRDRERSPEGSAHSGGSGQAGSDEEPGDEGLWRTIWKDVDSQRVERALTWVLGIALVVSVIGVGYVSMTAESETDPFTEFYVLGPDGNASGYPTNLTTGDTGNLIVGITNREQTEMTYRVALRLENRTVSERTATVSDGETWEDEFSITPETAGEKTLRILLYTGSDSDSSEPYRSLRLLISVSDAGRSSIAVDGRSHRSLLEGS